MAQPAASATPKTSAPTRTITLTIVQKLPRRARLSWAAGKVAVSIMGPRATPNAPPMQRAGPRRADRPRAVQGRCARGASLILVARRSRDRRGGGFERDPLPAVRALALDEHVGALLPGQDGGALVVEDEVAPVGADHQDRVPVPVAVEHHRHAHRTPGQAALGEQLALEDLIVLAIAVAVVRKVPAVDDAPVLPIGHRLDAFVHLAVDDGERLPVLRGEGEDRGLCEVDPALGRPAPAEVGPGRGRMGPP